MTTRKIMAGLFVCCVLLQIHAADLDWGTDLPKALAQAKSEKKMVFLDFTGSDWCPGCILFHDQVAASPKFASYAKTNLVLVEVDFPNKKPQSDALKAANDALQKKYDIEGFPTFILLDMDGKQLVRQTGYAPDSADAFMAGLEKLGK